MQLFPARSLLLRDRNEGEQRVTQVELFFDLVFVFAITQLSHLLASQLSLEGWLQTGILLSAIWWAWMYTTWMTNWFDPDQIPIRLVLIVIMLLSLVMSSSIPDAVGQHGWLFALAWAAIHVGRPLMILWSPDGDRNRDLKVNFQRILVWSLAASVI